MSFNALITKVEQAERAVDASRAESAAQWQQLRVLWRASWTPGRIIIAGLATGFAVGRTQPLRWAGSGGVLNLISALSGLIAAGSAQAVAEAADPTASAAGTVSTADARRDTDAA